jgi:hypothetical protein
MVTCGAQKKHGYCHTVSKEQRVYKFGSEYNKGCGGGTGEESMQYLKDWGLTWAACKPYTAGSGLESSHVDIAASLFLKPDPQFQSCGRTCVRS